MACALGGSILADVDGGAATDIPRGDIVSQYKTLRTWSVVLIFIGIMSIISAGIGVVAWAIAVEGVWETIGVLAFGAPIALLLASWPVALGQALRAIADIGDAVVIKPNDRIPAGI
jgi:hypothetical protein